ncbi:hypothetical protein D3P96_03165 [Weissella viridescens]|uniref:Uncharacterized protein n=1 Tax=Weissella viridescens TaxID=1629 RepID=A0A3P2RC17_WEIVI|nr:hypothetical protein [Weissella viridescens]RRG18299.1 hypothetical protein D3P96_03165 [Weissella viridescens]
MVVNRRPIVYYETLRRQSYAQQVKEIMAAKTAYILYADDDVVDDESAVMTDSVKPVVLDPVEVLVLEPQQRDVVLDKAETDVTDIPVVETRPATDLVAQTQNDLPEVTETVEEPVAQPTSPKPTEARTSAGNMTGLGLSLDSIFGEEKQAAEHAQSKYFKDSK